MAKLYVSEEPGDDGWTRWIAPDMEKYRLSCCDCGLIHDMEYDVDKDGQIWFRAKRNERATAQHRRYCDGEFCKRGQVS